MQQSSAAIADLVARIAYMPRFGEAIRERREWLELDGPELAVKSQELEARDRIAFQRFSQQTFSRWEGDRTGELIASSSMRRLRSLAYLLQWSAAEMVQRVGVHPGYVPDFDEAEPTALNDTDAPRPLGGLVSIRHLGSVTAGTEGTYDTHDYEYVEFPIILLNGYDPDDLFALTVVGDSMMCDDVQRDIPEGATALFHAHLQPEPGDTIVAWADHPELGDIRVLKIHRPGGGYVTLESLNNKHRPIVISHDADFRIFGVFLASFNPGRRLRHTLETRGMKAQVNEQLAKVRRKD